MYDTQVLGLLRKHFKDDTEVVVTPATPPKFIRHDPFTPGQRTPPGYYARLAMSDARFEAHLQIVQDKLHDNLLPTWVHRRRRPVQK